MTITALPAWLDAPPERLARPPVRPRAQALPYEELDWPNFERLVLRLLRVDHSVTGCEIYGKPGQAQHGIDVLAVSANAPDHKSVYQCKKVERFGAGDVTEAVAKFENGPWAAVATEFTLCVACSLDSTDVVEAIAEERTRLAKRGIHLKIWDGSNAGDLSTRLKKHADIVDDFFGREWVSAFNGREATDQLGDRLDGIDFNALRARFADLYATVFSQHDPGLRVELRNTIDYLERYVARDVQETATLESLGQELPTNPIDVASHGGERHGKAMPPVPLAVEQFSARRAIGDWIADKNDCVVLGEPGYGKSAFLRQLSLAMARAAFEESAPIGGAHLHRLPVWISFARFAVAVSENRATSVDDFFCRWLHQYGYGDVQSLFRRALNSSDLVILVDGLDEAATIEAGREALDRLITFGRSHRAILLCTSRPQGLVAMPVPTSWPRAVLASLSDAQITELATRWFSVLEASIVGGQTDAVRARAVARGAEFFDAVKVNERTRELARSPLLCQAFLEMFRLSHRLPEARVRAYGEIIELFLRRHPQARAHAGHAGRHSALAGIRDSDLKDMIVQIALDSQFAMRGGITSRDRCSELCARYLEDEVEGLGMPHSQATRRAPEIVDSFITYFGLLIERGPGDVSFVHLSLQEFLAALGMTSKPEEAQLRWLRDCVLDRRWRECLISWFGIQGESGKKLLASRAIDAFQELAGKGEWERLQVLSLATELACADLGLPIRESRAILTDARIEVESSPYPALRSALARHIAAGALGGAIGRECADAINRWSPGRDSYERARLLKALQSWSPSEDLATTLRRALLDERVECRRAAAETLAHSFHGHETTGAELNRISRTDVRPEVRAAALHALNSTSDWMESAVASAKHNANSHEPELLLECAGTKVNAGCQSTDDLQTLRGLWEGERVDYALREELGNIIARGWPDDDNLRGDCLRMLQQSSGTSEFPVPLNYLLQNRPGDMEVATVIADLLHRFGFHMGLERVEFWGLLTKNFRGNAPLGTAVRAALVEYKQKYKEIFWGPNSIPAYVFLSGESDRDELISGYGTADLQGRSWIAKGLIEGWAHDPIVERALQNWSTMAPEFSAPLARYAETLRPERAERLRWLEYLVREADYRLVARPIYKLLEERPDQETWRVVKERLTQPRLWYYDRIRIEARLVAHYPTLPESRATMERALNELDGPPFGEMASAFEHDATSRSQLLAAAVTAPTDVRLAVCSVLYDRGGQPDAVEKLTPAVFSEETGAVRSAGVIARARAWRNSELNAGTLSDALAEEAIAIGHYMDRRRRAGLAGLLELGQYARVAEIMAKDDSIRLPRLTDTLDSDVVAVGTILKHWAALRDHLVAIGSAGDLPLESLIDEGYGPLIERVPSLQQALDLTLQTPAKAWRRGLRLELLARRFPSSRTLRDALIGELDDDSGQSTARGDDRCVAARLLSEHFAGDNDVLSAVLREEQPARRHRHWVPGMTGYFVRGWPESDFAHRARAVSEDDRLNWPARDRLLCAIAWAQPEDAESAATKMLSRRYWAGFASSESTHVLRLWAKTEAAQPVFRRWLDSDDGDKIVAALLLGQFASSAADVGHLTRTFNQLRRAETAAPLDGYDPIAGRVVPVNVALYSKLSSLTDL